MADAATMEAARKNGQIVVLVEPTHFMTSEHTSQDNPFMRTQRTDVEACTAEALAEHKGLRGVMDSVGIKYKVVPQPHPGATDAIYASDSYLSFKNADFPDGVIVRCPMYWPNRRLEKNAALEEFVQKECGYKTLIDLSYFEKEDKALEGRGVTLFDWHRRVVYAGSSNRAHKDVLEKLCEHMTEISGKKYTAFMIDSVDPKTGKAPFHTTCFFGILTNTVIVDWSGVKDPAQREQMEKDLSENYTIISVNYDEMYAGLTLGMDFNLPEGGLCLLMGKSTYEVMRPETAEKMNKQFAKIVQVDLATNMEVGGSAIECLIQPVAL